MEVGSISLARTQASTTARRSLLITVRRVITSRRTRISSLANSARSPSATLASTIRISTTVLPNTNTLFADHSFTFTVVAAGAPAPHPPSVHLALGNPSNAVADHERVQQLPDGEAFVLALLQSRQGHSQLGELASRERLDRQSAAHRHVPRGPVQFHLTGIACSRLTTSGQVSIAVT